MKRTRTKVQKTDAYKIAEMIRTTRLARNLTQGDFAEAVGVSQQKLSDWEQGKRLRSVMIAWRLADVLGKAVPEV